MFVLWITDGGRLGQQQMATQRFLETIHFICFDVKADTINLYCFCRRQSIRSRFLRFAYKTQEIQKIDAMTIHPSDISSCSRNVPRTEDFLIFSRCMHNKEVISARPTRHKRLLPQNMNISKSVRENM